MKALELVPMARDEASAFVTQHHRHHGRPAGHCFAIGAASGGVVVGVAMVGRPVSRALQDGWTAEVTRLCVLRDQRNVCSLLYGACWRAARAIGYRRLVTYTLPTEGGASLRGAGWTLVGAAGGGSWSTPSRPRVDKHPTQTKLRWERAT